MEEVSKSGSENVAKVFANWPGLRHRAKVGLVWMASLAMDNGNPPVFFGDRGALAWAIGADISNEEASMKAVQEVIKELRRDGAIVWSGQGRAGVRASYALALDVDHTFQPLGSGRSVEWQKISRPELPVGMRSKAAAGLLPAALGSNSKGEEISPPTEIQTPEFSPPQLEKMTESQGEEISPDRLRESLPPTTRDSNFYFNQSIQSKSPSRLKGTSARTSESDGLKREPSQEDERRRQLDALAKIIPASERKAS